MTIFDKREDGFEQEFLHDKELRFKIIASGTSCLACGRGKSLENYAKDVVDAYLGETGEHDVFDRLRKDFNTAKVNASDAEIRQVMNETLSRATALIQAGK